MQYIPLLATCVLLMSGCAESPLKDVVDRVEAEPLPQVFSEDAEDAFVEIERQLYPELPDRLVVETLAQLPDAVNETSGLAYRNGRLWTHNDRGHDASLFELTESGDAVRRRVHPLGSENEDWEALAQDDDYLYIADCGNNHGDRIWMQIYKVAWEELDQTRHQGVVASERLNIRLADTRPQRNSHAHDNDCEALAVVDDQLWLFTKNWQDHNTRLYRLDKQASVQQVVSSGEYPARGLITGADYDPQTQRLALIGYRIGFLNLAAFIWLVPVVDGSPDWDQASYHRLSPLGQWEAILWHEGDLLVTRESSVLGRALLGRIRLP
ncbi:MAG: hypothetical protein ACK4L8_07515 [Nitrincola lacisaponensis]